MMSWVHYELAQVEEISRCDLYASLALAIPEYSRKTRDRSSFFSIPKQ